MNPEASRYPARLDVDYPETLDRLSTALRVLYVIPIAILWSLVANFGFSVTRDTANGTESASISSGLVLAVVLMLLFRRRYPRWWFDFLLELSRFAARVGAYALLLTDRYPSTEDPQSVHLDLDYPDATRLNRWLPLVKWLLALPHAIILVFLWLAVVLVAVVAWFAVLITGQYPRPLFDFVVGVGRWSLRVHAYAFLLITDAYPPFSLE